MDEKCWFLRPYRGEFVTLSVRSPFAKQDAGKRLALATAVFSDLAYERR